MKLGIEEGRVSIQHKGKERPRDKRMERNY